MKSGHLLKFIQSDEEEKKKRELLNCSSKKELDKFQVEDSPSRFATRSPWTNISTTCEASEDELRGPSGASTPHDSNRALSPSVASPVAPITNQVCV